MFNCGTVAVDPARSSETPPSHNYRRVCLKQEKRNNPIRELFDRRDSPSQKYEQPARLQTIAMERSAGLTAYVCPFINRAAPL